MNWNINFMFIHHINPNYGRNLEEEVKVNGMRLTKINGILTSESCKYLTSFSSMVFSPVLFMEADNFVTFVKWRIVFSNSIHATSTSASAP